MGTVVVTALWHDACVAILCYHSVDAAWESPLAVSPAAFERDCRWLRTTRRVATATQLAEAMAQGRSSRRAVAVTFDDGFADFLDQAMPILQRHDVPVTLFVVAATLTDGNGGATWLRPQPEDAPATLTAEQVCHLRDLGVDIGNHSWAHHDLRELTEQECLRDLTDSRALLEDTLRQPVPLLAYPYGFHAPHVRRAAQAAGHSFAFSLPEKREFRGRYAVPRAGIYRGNSAVALRVKSSNWYMSGRVDRGYFATRRPGLPDDPTSS